MYKSAILIAVILVNLGAMTVKAQSIVDPGISTHNYKHPQKAAKANQNERNIIRVENLNTVESNYKKQNQDKLWNTTPKYAPRPAALTIDDKYQEEKVNINPLVSPRNYKRQNLTESKK